MGKNRFYCPTCKKFIDRRSVYNNRYDLRFMCKKCKCPVLKTEKILKAALRDFIDYEIINGETEIYE